MISSDKYIKALTRTVQNLPSVFQDWDTLDTDLMDVYIRAVEDMLTFAHIAESDIPTVRYEYNAFLSALSSMENDLLDKMGIRLSDYNYQ